MNQVKRYYTMYENINYVGACLFQLRENVTKNYNVKATLERSRF